MNILIGSTGVLGSTLKDTIKFDYEYNSSNIQEILNLTIDLTQCNLYLCCLPATKWKINQNPSGDFDNILSIVGILSKRSYANIALYSTIDIYQNAPHGSDESYIPESTELDYGNNRLLFEKLVEKVLVYNNLTIIRLPALFGKHIKKNILYDLLNNNQVAAINYNSQYQWYNLEELAIDTDICIANTSGVTTYNLFPEPLETSEILKLFNIDKTHTNQNSEQVKYNYKTRTTESSYRRSAQQVLQEMADFVDKYRLSKVRMAVCLFGEQRDILQRVQDWKTFQSRTNCDFFISLYSNENIGNTIDTLTANLPVKDYCILDNNLEAFDRIKYNATTPIHLYGIDPKATFARITSQLYIRQKAVDMVNVEDYDVILLCRSDLSNFNITTSDIHTTFTDKNTLIVNSGTHNHPGGGGGCTECSVESRCSKEYHANDICDHWCVGSTLVMKNWSRVYDDVLDLYADIQGVDHELSRIGIPYVESQHTNEVTFYPRIDNLIVIENNIHCYYPEKIMRSLFKDVKIIDATHNKDIWK